METMAPQNQFEESHDEYLPSEESGEGLELDVNPEDVRYTEVDEEELYKRQLKEYLDNFKEDERKEYYNNLETLEKKIQAEISEVRKVLLAGEQIEGPLAYSILPANDTDLNIVYQQSQFADVLVENEKLGQDYLSRLKTVRHDLDLWSMIKASLAKVTVEQQEQYVDAVDANVLNSVGILFSFQINNILSRLALQRRERGHSEISDVEEALALVTDIKKRHVDYLTWLDIDITQIEKLFDNSIVAINLYHPDH